MKASDIMRDAGVVLLDEEHIRWPLEELASWIDKGVSQIVSVKPSAASTMMDLPLVRGTKQSLPEDDRIVQLLDILRNSGANGVGGRMVRSASRAELDSNEPYWHDPTRTPFRREVRQFVFDELLPRTFFVYPGNDGTGSVEAAVSRLPEPLADRVTGDKADIGSWEIPVGLPDHYHPILLDYVLYRAFSKEDPAATMGQSVTHYQAFATGLGIKSQVESQTSPKKS